MRRSMCRSRDEYVLQKTFPGCRPPAVAGYLAPKIIELEREIMPCARTSLIIVLSFVFN